MRIAMMTNNYKPYVGGVPISVERLAEGLRARGHEVTVFAPAYPGVAEEPGVVRIRAMHSLWKGDYLAPSMFDPKTEAAFKAGNFQLIHVHHPVLMGHMGLYLSRKYGVPLVFTYHTRYEEYLHYARLKPNGAAMRFLQRTVPAHNRAFMNRCSLLFAPTPLMRNYLRDIGVTAPVEVLPTGLGAEDFAQNAAQSAALRRRYAPGGQRLLCTVARVEPEKNIGFLLRALARHKAEGGAASRLVVVGDGSAREGLQKEAEALGLAEDVFFVGCVPHEQLAAWYGAADLFVFASKSETQGIVLLEAMAGGLPVLALAASGVDDVVVNGVNGLRTREDEAVFAKELGALLQNDALRAQLAANARVTADACRAEQVAGQAERYYQAAIAGGLAPAGRRLAVG